MNGMEIPGSIPGFWAILSTCHPCSLDVAAVNERCHQGRNKATPRTKMLKSLIILAEKKIIPRQVYDSGLPNITPCCHSMTSPVGKPYPTLSSSCLLLMAEGCLGSCSALQASLDVVDSAARAMVTVVMMHWASWLRSWLHTVQNKEKSFLMLHLVLNQ